MKPSNLSVAAVMLLTTAALFFIWAESPPAWATTTTSTIIGWLAPDATHLANSMLVIIMPLAGLVFFVWLGRVFRIKGDAGVYLALSGLTIGAFISDLPASGTNTLAVPFADGLVSGILLFLWWWNS